MEERRLKKNYFFVLKKDDETIFRGRSDEKHLRSTFKKLGEKLD